MYSECVDSWAKSNGTCFLCGKITKLCINESNDFSGSLMNISTDTKVGLVLIVNDSNSSSPVREKLLNKPSNKNEDDGTTIKCESKDFVSKKVSDSYIHHVNIIMI